MIKMRGDKRASSRSGFNYMNILAKPKRAVSGHIEMIIAFMLFIVFVMFLLVFIKPYERNTLSESVLNGLHKNFEDNVSVNLTSVFVKVNDCSDGIDVTLLPVDIGSQGVVGEGAGDYVYLLVSSDILDDSSNVFGACEDFTVGSIETKKIISQEKLEQFAGNYPYIYNDLRSALGVPKTIDFIIEFEGGGEMEKYIPSDVNVIAQFTTKPVLLSDGSIENREFVFRIW